MMENKIYKSLLTSDFFFNFETPCLFSEISLTENEIPGPDFFHFSRFLLLTMAALYYSYFVLFFSPRG